MAWKLTLLLVALVFLAGCATTDGEDASTEEDPSVAIVTTSASPPDGEERPFAPTQNDTFVQRMEWSECRPWGAAFDWPGNAEHAEQPPGWEPGPRVETFIQMHGWTCDRVHWGPYERGPVTFILEFHNNQETPESCYPDLDDVEFAVSFTTVNSVWIDDQELVDYAREYYGMPAYYSPITVQNESTPAGPLGVIRWGLPGQESMLEILHYDGRLSPYPVSEKRMFWYNDTGVSYMDADFYHQAYQIYDARYGHGVLEPPMLMAEWPTDYYYISEWYGEGHASMEFARFLDFYCEEPA